jgi:predicted nuclease of predicted toxin-antitoxin system
MRFLADESCDFAVVRALRAAGHDVIAVAEVALGTADEAVIDLALREQRLLLTEDKDFGRIVFASAKPNPGVIFIRFPASARGSLPQAVLEVVSNYSDRLVNSFVVLQPSRVRISRTDHD